jgi:ABC-type branched-subunit amino acid transport system ATPase component
MTKLLEVDELVVQYGPAVAVDRVSLDLDEGERVALIGPNGAGKSSLLNAVCGIVKPAAGTVRIRAQDVTAHSPGEIVRLGISQVPEGRQVFPSLPVESNLLLGAYGRDFRFEPILATVRYLRRRGEIQQRLERVYGLLPKLHELKDRPAGQTSGGEQQMVAIGRALMPQPRLVIFDELSLGLAPKVIDEIFAVIPQILEWGVAVVLIEQNVHRSLEIADRAYVIERGEVVLSGRADELEDVQQAYFGARTSTLTTGGDG